MFHCISLSGTFAPRFDAWQHTKSDRSSPTNFSLTPPTVSTIVCKDKYLPGMVTAGSGSRTFKLLHTFSSMFWGGWLW